MRHAERILSAWAKRATGTAPARAADPPSAVPVRILMLRGPVWSCARATHNLSYGIPVMLAIMVAKLVGDQFNDGPPRVVVMQHISYGSILVMATY